MLRCSRGDAEEAEHLHQRRRFHKNTRFLHLRRTQLLRLDRK